MACANTTGSHKIPSAMIGKAKKPACIVGRSWPVPYYPQKKAWMDVVTCTKCVDEFFVAGDALWIS